MISVAIAAYNGERFIRQQLESIKNQTVPVDEVVICDDCSSDSTVEICRSFIAQNALNGWTVHVNEQNRGYCFNYYGAIDLCGGDIIFLADQDDVWYPEKVEKMLACMEAVPEICVLASRYHVIDADSNIIENSGVTYLGSCFDDSVEFIDAESLIGCSYIRGFSLCFKKEIKEILKPIDLQSLLSHDWLICMLGCMHGGTAILNTVLAGYRYHGDNVSLSAMSRKTRVRRLDKRIKGLRESISGHSYLLSLMTDSVLKEKTEKFIAFEKRRLTFLVTQNPLRWAALGFSMGEYGRYYKGGGMRVWLGDLAYVCKKNG